MALVTPEEFIIFLLGGGGTLVSTYLFTGLQYSCIAELELRSIERNWAINDLRLKQTTNLIRYWKKYLLNPIVVTSFNLHKGNIQSPSISINLIFCKLQEFFTGVSQLAIFIYPFRKDLIKLYSAWLQRKQCSLNKYRLLHVKRLILFLFTSF